MSGAAELQKIYDAAENFSPVTNQAIKSSQLAQEIRWNNLSDIEKAGHVEYVCQQFPEFRHYCKYFGVRLAEYDRMPEFCGGVLISWLLDYL